MKTAFRTTLGTALLMAGLAVSARAATITYVGVLTDTNAWRYNTTLTLALDPNGDKPLGSDGWSFSTGTTYTNSLPTYISSGSVSNLGGIFGDQNLIVLDDPSVALPAGGPVADVTWGKFRRSAGSGNLFSFTVSSATNFLLTVVADTYDGITGTLTRNPTNLTITSSVSGSLTQATPTPNGQLDFMVFDITAAAGETFTISGFAGGGTRIAIGGVAWEALAIPEPSAWTLVGFGLFGTWVLGRRRRARPTKAPVAAQHCTRRHCRS